MFVWSFLFHVVCMFLMCARNHLIMKLIVCAYVQLPTCWRILIVKLHYITDMCFLVHLGFSSRDCFFLANLESAV